MRAKCTVRGGRPQGLPCVVAAVSRTQKADRRAGGGVDRPEMSSKISSMIGQAILAGALVFGGMMFCIVWSRKGSFSQLHSPGSNASNIRLVEGMLNGQYGS